MTHRVSLRLVFATPGEAARVAASLAPENDGFVTVRQEGATLLAEAVADAPLGLLRTLDDLLACAGAAQRAGRLGAPRERDV